MEKIHGATLHKEWAEAEFSCSMRTAKKSAERPNLGRKFRRSRAAKPRANKLEIPMISPIRLLRFCPSDWNDPTMNFEFALFLIARTLNAENRSKNPPVTFGDKF